MPDLRTIERESIRAFVQRAADEGYLSGRVLDYGAGKQPWREIVEAAGGEYVPYDRAEFPGNVSGDDVGDDKVLHGAYEAVISTQTIQYWEDVEGELSFLRTRINDGGTLLITGPTNWPVVEKEDRRRYTPTEAMRLLQEARFSAVDVVWRAELHFFNENWLIGWEAVAVA